MSTRAQSSDSLTIPKSALRRLAMAVAGLVALALIALAVLALFRALSSSDPLASAIDKDKYQAVFLSNGQVYFGKLSAPGGDFYYLDHVYYLSTQASQVRGQKTPTPRQTLIHLGTVEIHAPEDRMVINRSEILFVENLKPSSQVTRAILKDRSG